MLRRATKIVATLGPASSDPALLEQMIRAGVNVVRLNFSHGKAQDHIDRARLVREAAQRAGREVAIMADLQCPKIRVGKFAEGKVFLEPGQKFVLDAARTELGDVDAVGLDYKNLPRDVKPGDTLELRIGPDTRTVVVKGLSGVRGPAPVAALLYEETAASLLQRSKAAEQRRLAPEPAHSQPMGRPTKRDRRQIEDLREAPPRGEWNERWSASLDDED